MGRSMRIANDLLPGAIPAEAVLSANNRSVRVYRDTTGWHQTETEPGVFVDDYKLEYVIGAGANGLSFIVRRGAYLFQAPLSYYSKTSEWGLSPGYEKLDLAFARPIAQECLLCHSGHPEPVPNRNGKYGEPPFYELAIGCENCHGPGSAHVNNPKTSGAIVNPAKLPPRLADDVCTNCHQRGDVKVLQPGKQYQDFRPGQWLLETTAIFKREGDSGRGSSDLLEHNSAMKMSRCFRGSSGKLSCLTCHDPHIQPAANEANAYFQRKCLTCHTVQSCGLPVPARRQQSPQDDCISCHMPKRNVTEISHSALTNHRIPARDNEPVPESAGQTDGTGLLLLNPSQPARTIPKITLLKTYGQLASEHGDYQARYLELLESVANDQPDNPYVQAARGHKKLSEGRNEEALALLIPALRLDESAVEVDVAQALTNLGRSDEALAHWEAAMRMDPYNPVLEKKLTLQYINLHRYVEADKCLRNYVETFPEDKFMRDLLARVQTRQ
jgi:hypothetical protein